MTTQTILGQESIGISSDSVETWIALAGGQIAPVTFHLEGREVQPFSIAPWAEENQDIPTILKVLRGDFFCAPFGGNEEPYGSEQFPIHGETANEIWRVVDQTASSVSMELTTTIRPGRFEKMVWNVPGQNAVYQRHTIRDMIGPMCFGHHAMVKFKSPGCVSVAPFGFGQVFPGQFEDPIIGGYSSLKPGAMFTSLDSVPSNDGSRADLTRYPAREGFEDLVMVYAEKGADFGWTAVTFPEEGYIWFSLKDPKVLSGTVLWHSNGGRHYAPWSSRHRGVLGLEEVTSYMHYGLAGSFAENDASKAGYRTYFEMATDKPMTINTIMGVAPCSTVAGPVREITVINGGVEIRTDDRGTFVPLNISELYGS